MHCILPNKHTIIIDLLARLEDNAEYKEQNYDRIRGEDKWIGRRVEKHFPGHGKFKGKVTDVDEEVPEHGGSSGHRIFQVVYDDGDDEWIGVDDLVNILLPPSAPPTESVCVNRFIFFLECHDVV